MQQQYTERAHPFITGCSGITNEVGRLGYWVRISRKQSGIVGQHWSDREK